MSKIELKISKVVQTVVTVEIEEGLSEKEKYEFINRIVSQKHKSFNEEHLDKLILDWGSTVIEDSYEVKDWDLIDE